jgi:hypothetical protein
MRLPTGIERVLSIVKARRSERAGARYSGLGFIRLRDNVMQAIEHFQQAFSLHTRAGDVRGQATTHNLLANAYFDTGQRREAEYHYRQARDIFDKIGDIYNRAFADNNLGEIALYQGRLNEAMNSYQMAVQAIEQNGGSPYVLGVLHMNLATSSSAGAIATATGNADWTLPLSRPKRCDFFRNLHRHLAEAANKPRPDKAESSAARSGAGPQLEMRARRRRSGVLGQIATARPTTTRHMIVTTKFAVLQKWATITAARACTFHWRSLNHRQGAQSQLSLCWRNASRVRPLGAPLDLGDARSMNMKSRRENADNV